MFIVSIFEAIYNVLEIIMNFFVLSGIGLGFIFSSLFY